MVLKRDILPKLLEDKQDDYIFRIWVAGCSTGEEAYSIAIVLRELMDERHQYFKVQIYATDIDDEVISIARQGIYSANISEDVNPEYLRRFFIHSDNGYTIRKDIREMVVFAVQSVIKDPPFTRLDLLSCRNLMIYLESEQQNRLIPLFHYALKPNGVLFLSSSESITNHPHLFKPLDRQWKFYGACSSETKPKIALSRNLTMTIPNVVVPYPVTVKGAVPLSVATLTNRILLQTYAPPSVTTDIEGNILYVHGDTSRFLHQPAGMITTNLIDMARVGLQLELRTALQAATTGKSTLNREILLKTENGTFTTSFSIRLFPLTNPEDKTENRLLLVSFQEAVIATKSAKHQSGQKLLLATEAATRAEQLEYELVYARENLQATIEAQQATNEELQSANEELETSREELQSMNEETLTMNSELSNKVEQLNSTQNDFKNLMDNVNTGVVFLDYHLNIRSYTRDAVKAYRLIATDAGRPLSDITSNLQGDDFTSELHTVLETLIPQEREVQATGGAWYLARMQPYRTLDNVIDGVVLSFTDITVSRETAQTKLSVMQLARELAEGIVNTVSEPLIVIDANLEIISASQAFYKQFQVEPVETVGQKLYDLGNGQWNIPALRQLLEDILPQRQVIEGFMVEHNFPKLGAMRMVLNARRIKTVLGDTELILLAIPTIEENLHDSR